METTKKRYEVFSKEIQYKDGKMVNESMASYGYTWAVSEAKAICNVCFRFGIKKSYTQGLGCGSWYTQTLIAKEAK